MLLCPVVTRNLRLPKFDCIILFDVDLNTVCTVRLVARYY